MKVVKLATIMGMPDLQLTSPNDTVDELSRMSGDMIIDLSQGSLYQGSVYLCLLGFI